MSDAKLVKIHFDRLAQLAKGTVQKLYLSGDFEDEKGVELPASYFEFASSDASVADITPTGTAHGLDSGTAILSARSHGIEAVNVVSVFTVQLDEEGVYYDEEIIDPGVYPGTLTLVANGGMRQLKVSDAYGAISTAEAGTRYFVGNPAIASVTPDGLVTGLAEGATTLTIINGTGQTTIELKVQVPSVGATVITAQDGGAVQGADGSVVLVGPGALAADTQVSIVDVTDLALPVPAPDVLDALAAFHLELGADSLNAPVQLAIPATAPIDPATGEPRTLAAGTEVFFLAEGTIVDEFGAEHATWWVMDNGYIGEDGVARTGRVISYDLAGNPDYVGQTGIIYVAPVLDEVGDDDRLAELRKGKRLGDATAEGYFTVDIQGKRYVVKLNVPLVDYDGPKSEFFGDRDLNNPGYSEFQLRGNVGTFEENIAIDVWRVEQRLKYLGFTAMGSEIVGYPKPPAKDYQHNFIHEFDVDGQFGDEEKLAIMQFQRTLGFADGEVWKNGTTLSWLNAYNAPHWMDIGGQMQYQSSRSQPTFSLTGWNNTQTDQRGSHEDVESYGTSWMRDLMRASSFAMSDFLVSIPRTGSAFTGATDANYGVTLKLHKTHGAGMSFDLSLALNYITGAFLAVNTAGPVPDWQQGQWSNADAVTLSAELPNYQTISPNAPYYIDDATLPEGRNLQRDALRNFLALYSVTRDNGEESNGWDDLPISNGNETQQAFIRRALFGDGTQQGSLINSVYIGSTQIGEADYLGMRTKLSQLGVENRAVDNHHDHFHINLNPPPRLGIGGSLLLAAAPTSATGGAVAPLGSETAAQDYEAVMSICQVAVPSGSELITEANVIAARNGPWQYFNSRGIAVDPDASRQVTLLEAPRHGNLQSEGYREGVYLYQAQEGYLGPDQMTFVVEMNGKKFKVIYSVDVTAGHPAASRPSDPCPSGYQIKELPNSGTNDNGSALDILELPSDGPLSSPRRMG